MFLVKQPYRWVNVPGESQTGTVFDSLILNDLRSVIVQTYIVD
jgi:hypothetical protein